MNTDQKYDAPASGATAHQPIEPAANVPGQTPSTAGVGQNKSTPLWLHPECIKEMNELYRTVKDFFEDLNAHEGATRALTVMLEHWLTTEYRDYAREDCDEDLVHWNNYVRDAFEVIKLLASLSERVRALRFQQDQVRAVQGGPAL